LGLFCALSSQTLGQTLSFLDTSGALTSIYAERTRAYVQVTDPAANVSPGKDTVQVRLSTTLGGDVELVTLTETGTSTGIFRGDIALAQKGAVSQPGVLETDTLRVPPYGRDTISADYDNGAATATASLVGSITRFLDVYGRPATRFAIGETIFIRVVAPLRNDPNLWEDFPIQVVAGSDQESVDLRETGVNTGIFEGSVPTTGKPPVLPDNVLETAPGQTAQATVSDPDVPTSSQAAAAMAASSVELIDAQGNPVTFYLESTRAYVRVRNAAADLNPSARDTATVQMTADLSGDQETVTLQETGTSTGIFEGSIPLRHGQSGLGSGTLETIVSSGAPYRFDTVRAAYADGAGGSTDAVDTIGSLTFFLDGYGNEVTSYAAGARVYLRVEDHNRNDPAVLDTVTATVQSPGSGDAEGVSLVETGRNTGIFEGSIPTGTSPSGSGNGVLTVQPGQTILAQHVDTSAVLASGAQAAIQSFDIRFIEATGEPTLELVEDGTARVRVTGPAANANPNLAETVTVHLQTVYSQDQEDLTLTETGPNTGVFEGSIRLNYAPNGTPYNGMLDTANNGSPPVQLDKVTATFADASVTARIVGSRVWFVDGYGRIATSFPVGGNVGVRLEKPALNNPGIWDQINSFEIDVRDGNFTHFYYLNLNETGPDTGIFEGTIPSSAVDSGLYVIRGAPGLTMQAISWGAFSSNIATASAVFTGGQVLFVDAQGQPASVYMEGTRAYVRVIDHQRAGTVAVQVTDELLGDQETVSLQETSAGSGIFLGSIDLSARDYALPGNGRLETGEQTSPVHSFDTLHASYTDSAGGASSATATTLGYRVWFLDAYGNVVSSYPQGARAYVRIEWHDFIDPNAVDSLSVRLQSAAGDLEFIQATETGRNTGIFEGSIPLDSSGAVSGGDGRLQALPGTWISADRNSLAPMPVYARIDAASIQLIDDAGRPTAEVLQSSTARVRVVSPADNHSSTAAEIVIIQVSSRYKLDVENVTLTETGLDTGIFEGSIPLVYTQSNAIHGNGVLETQDSGDVPQPKPEEVKAIFGAYSATAQVIGSRIVFIDDFGRETTTFPVGANVGVRLIEPASNNPGSFDTVYNVQIGVQYGFGTSYWQLNLDETGRDTGVFEGRLPSSPNSSSQNVILGAPGRILKVNHLNPYSPLTAMAQATFSGGRVLFVDAQGQPASVYLEGTRAYLRVEDHLAAGPRSVQVTDELSGDQETVTLRETSAGSGIFLGSIGLSFRDTGPLPGNGVLETGESFGPPFQYETIHASYTDSTSASSTATATTLGYRVWFLDAYGNLVSSYPQGTRAYVRIEWHNFIDPNVVDSLTLRMQSATGDTEYLQVMETGRDTGIFEGSIPLDSSGAASAGDGRLQAPPGTWISADRNGITPPMPVYAGIDGASVQLIDDAGRPTAEVLQSSTARVRVVSPADNHSSTAVETVIVQVSSRYKLDVETVTLTETGPDTGVFEGSIPLVYTQSNAIHGNGVLETQDSGDIPQPKPEEVKAIFDVYSATAQVIGSRIIFIDDFGRETTTFPVGANVGVRLIEPASNNPGSFDTVYNMEIGVTYDAGLNSTGTTFRYLSLYETGLDTGVFEGRLPSSPNSSSQNVIPAAPGRILTATHANPYSPLTATAQATFTGGRVTFVDAQGQPASVYLEGTRAYLRVEDHLSAGPRNVQVTTELSGDQETVTLQETSAGSGIFLGSIDLSLSNVASPGNGRLETGENPGPPFQYETIHARYTDSTSASSTATATTLGYRVWFLDAAGAVVNSYVEGSHAYVRLEDHNYNDPNRIDILYVELDSSLGDQEFLRVTETGVATGIYEGSIPLGRGAVAVGDGRLQAPAGGEITADRQGAWFPAPVHAGIDAAPPNRPPVANDDTATLDEDGSVDVPVLANDSDPDGDTLSVTAVTQGVHGAVTINPDKTVKYTPAANYNGSDSFTYTVSDGNGGTATGTVTITVTSVNDAPVANVDSATVAEDGSVDVPVLANDSDPDGDTLSVESITQPSHGAATINPDKTVKYTPAANYNGSDSFTYTVSDGNGGTATGTVTVTITAVNDAPAANADSATVAEDGTVNVAVLGNDTDADGDTLSVTAVTQGAHGAVAINPDKTVKYTPAANYNGSDSFTYTVSDGNGGTATGTVTITVTSVNDAPVANADSATVAEDGAVNVAVLGNDTDADGDTLSVTAVTQGAHGAVAINPDKTVKYTPAANYNGSDSFTYTISDGNGGTATGTVTVTITAVNDAPVANADSATVAEDGTVDVAVLGNDTDADGDTLSVTAVIQGAHGTVAINPDKTVKYTPAANYNGSDSFTYTVSDGNGGTATGTVTITVTSVNDAPVANADSATVAEDGTVNVAVLGNDTDADGDTLSVASVIQSAHGTVAINPDKTVKYTPAANYNGSDSFTYTVSDGNGGTATGTVTITVTPVNDAPVANADSATVAEDGTVNVAVLGNDTDADGDTLTVTAVTQAAHGAVVINPDKTVKYTPAANYNGSDSFTYTVSDGNGGTATGTVTVTITAVNDAPVANADSATVAEDGTVNVAVLGNDTDADGDTLSVASVTQGAHGTVTINPDKTVKYIPAANYNGSDSFMYTASDGNGGTATGTVTITVTPVNDAPVANADSATVAEDGTVNVAVLGNDTDVDGDTLSVASVTQGAHGTVTINPDKTVKYTPAANYNGSDSFTYTVSDGNGGTATGTVTVTITAVNDAPVANADSATVAEDGTVNVEVLGNDTDADGDTLSVASVTQGAHGTVAINPDKTVKYTPAANYNGSDSFMYTASDGNGGTATGTVTITVTPVNDAPVANADSATVAEDGTINVAVLGNDTDADGDTLLVTAVTQGAHGAVVINPDKTVKYTPAANYNGPDAFTYTISDGHGGTATGTVTITVTAVNDAPVAVNDSATVVAGGTVTVSVLANDTDIDGPGLSVTSVTQGAHGSVAINPNQTVTYTASLFVGTDSFTYTVSDGAGGTATATVTVSLTAPARVATGIQARYNFNEGSGSTVNDTSGVGTPLNLTISSPSSVSWISGGLKVNTATAISTSGFASKIISAAQSSNALTVEAWVTPSSLTLTGPARIATIVKSGSQRNLVFGQSGSRYETQLKTSTGTASLQSPASSLTQNLTHVVYTRSNSGPAVWYINGVQVSTQTTTGNLSTWGTDQKLTLSDNWQGSYFLLAVYGRALTGAEVQQNYLAGPDAN